MISGDLEWNEFFEKNSELDVIDELIHYRLSLYLPGTTIKPIFLALKHQKNNVLTWILEQKFNPNELDMNGIPCLIIATWTENSEAIILLLNAGADVDIQDDNGSTSLHIAAMICNVAIVQILISYGADQTIKDYDQDLAIDLVDPDHKDGENTFNMFYFMQRNGEINEENLMPVDLSEFTSI